MHKLTTVESLLKKNYEMAPKDIWWELAIREQEYFKEFQTSFEQMMNQIDLLVKENKIMLYKDGTYLWIVPSKKILESLKDAVEL